MRIVCISDTHGQHKRVKLPEGDVLIHAGDFTMGGGTAEVGGFLNWLKQQPHKHKILIAGNHDRLFERDSALAESMVPAGVTYLNDSGTVIEGLNFWGSPVQPKFGNLAFNRNQAEIVAHWELIPAGTGGNALLRGAVGILEDRVSHVVFADEARPSSFCRRRRQLRGSRCIYLHGRAAEDEGSGPLIRLRLRELGGDLLGRLPRPWLLRWSRDRGPRARASVFDEGPNYFLRIGVLNQGLAGFPIGQLKNEIGRLNSGAEVHDLIHARDLSGEAHRTGGTEG